MTAPTTTLDLQEFAQTLGQEIAAALQPAGGSWQASPSRALEPADQDLQQRFLPLLATLLPTVVSAVPSIINDIRRRRRDLPAAPTDPQQAQEEFQAVLAEIVPVLVESLPELLETLEEEGADLAPDDPEATTRFFGALLGGSMLPDLISVVPNVISALGGGRRDLGGEAYQDPEITSRFIGNILGSVFSTVAKPIGQLLGGAGGGGGRPQRPQRPARPQRPQRPVRPVRPGRR